MSAELISIPTITRLSKNIIRILGSNPGPFTLQGTNTYLVGQGPHRALIDTGAGVEAYAASLKKVLTDENCTINKVFITHHHYDHVDGIDQVLSLSSPVKIYKKHYSEDPENNSYINIHSEQTFDIEPNLNLISLLAPGHCQDHVCFILKQDRILFSGDMILGQGTAVFDNLSDYMKSLNLVKNYPTPFDIILPGHGPEMNEPSRVIQEYIDHRMERENQILGILAKSSDDPNQPTLWTSAGIVKVIYEGYPDGVLLAAERVVNLHLDKLLVDDKVTKTLENDTIYWELKKPQLSNL